LYLVCVFSCTVLFVSISQVIGCEDCLRNDLDCVMSCVKLFSDLVLYFLTDFDFSQRKYFLEFKGELNPNNKLGLIDSFSTRINKYNPHTVQFCVI